jgi:hypothetical protein
VKPKVDVVKETGPDPEAVRVVEKLALWDASVVPVIGKPCVMGAADAGGDVTTRVMNTSEKMVTPVTNLASPCPKLICANYYETSQNALAAWHSSRVRYRE